jgi:hypothetical protein
VKLKRGAWIATCSIGAALFGGIAVLLGAMFFRAADDGVRAPSGVIEWAVTFILIAGACASALFLTPRQIDQATAIEVDDEPAQWIKDMRRDQDKGR